MRLLKIMMGIFFAITSVLFAEKFSYPTAPKHPVTDVYHGTTIVDPYRWLEDSASAETKEWIRSQENLTQKYFSQFPERGSIKARLTEFANFERFGGSTIFRGGRYFFLKNNGLQPQNVLHFQEKTETESSVLVDPNSISENGSVSLPIFSVSPDGKLVAYCLSESDSIWVTCKVRNVQSGTDLAETLTQISLGAYSIAWTSDNRGFYYGRYDHYKKGAELTTQLKNHRIYYHKIGTDQSKDQLIYEDHSNEELYFTARVTEDGQYLILRSATGGAANNSVLYRGLNSQNSKFEVLFAPDSSYTFLGSRGSKFWFQTSNDAPGGRIIMVYANQPSKENWKEVVPETENSIQFVNMVGNHLLVAYNQDAKLFVQAFQLDGKFRYDLSLPGIGTIFGGFTGLSTDPESYYWFSSITDPVTVYRLDVESGKSSIFRRPKLPFQPEDFVTEQVFYKSDDGTRIPMFLTYKKGIQRDKPLPTLLYGYGALRWSAMPFYTAEYLLWLERGGLFAMPNIRGGGEYGSKWHKSGSGTFKENTLNDYIAAARWLISEKYTTRKSLVAYGGSIGAIVAGVALTRTPDLFGAALINIPVLDMLRYENFTGARRWIGDLGSVANPQEFKALLAYSPYHNIRKGTAYPPTLITTGDKDDVAVPGHSFKFTAALQDAQSGSGPILLRIDWGTGHGFNKPVQNRVAEWTDELVFLFDALENF